MSFKEDIIKRVDELLAGRGWPPRVAERYIGLSEYLATREGWSLEDWVKIKEVNCNSEELLLAWIAQATQEINTRQTPDEISTATFVAKWEYILRELQAPRIEAAQRLKEQEDNHIKEMATDIATKAVEAAVEVFMDEKKKDELRLQKDANDRILAIKREYELMMEQKDEIIQKFKDAAENYKKAYEALKTSIDFTHLTEQFLQLAQKNQYYLALIKEMQNPLDPLLFRAASTGDFESVKAAIRLGADVNVQDHLLDTPLHKAVAADEIAIVRLLLVNRCDPTKVNMVGKTADELTENKEIIKLINGYKNPAIQQQPTLSSNSSSLFYKGQMPAVDSNNVQPNYTPSNIH